jgi:hypothetical protein
MKKQADCKSTAYRSLFIACFTLVLVQLAARFFLNYRGVFILHQLSLEMVGFPGVLTGYVGCALLLASFFYSRLKDPLLYFGILVSVIAIFLWRKSLFILA